MSASCFDPAARQASTLVLPAGPWATVFDCLCAHFAKVPAEQWEERFARRRVLDAAGEPLARTTPYRQGMRVHYFREVPGEPLIDVQEHVLYQDEHLVIADKPHFLPVTPAGKYVEQTLLRRLIRTLGNADLVPLHRIDRHTAGLVMFSAQPASRGAYQALFAERRIHKVYQAIAPGLPTLSFPHRHASRMVKGEPFFRMCEVPGEPNSETHIHVLERREHWWRYELWPVTGKTHQLRVHMAGLGAALCNDPFYPAVAPEGQQDDFDKPLKLLAQSVAFDDPITREPRHFTSRLELGWP
ncbi:MULTISPECIES: pseudouridine synthase [unclassified Pseudomonas]|uniref:pseudouridine synthase n=1 Tax=unclassified Pseudomonas TaxID=196821 RepID=UPI000BD70B63|nr:MULTISPECIES: pseudouridine synthase [unclassified Pseudomonas]PVZ20357.1 23S rRNA-/tRNA-specific pseudouridylate synthase [Pseudomonas sp. URIL14HWK12:I12]PVZ27423.1 23S rRNA-/tRNA-specific pseudouridylate synthase [Pseudomonas sp. URIL14HWK12:I10]PVZ38312.1 23S rRNA-/tRNA-specific pseudouridylate synthase [Pseudomonas sp. URIL14HWK12:I11]SNZ03861.1 tRNA pseudouridine32 synthase / 23S rRNA pseudouridine746 synthase [Pseudomonas sp. URIL14HWK12:I9]